MTQTNRGSAWAVQTGPDFAGKALFILPDVCVFVDGVARPGATLKDFAPEDIEAVEFYGAPRRDFLGNSARDGVVPGADAQEWDARRWM